MNCSRPYQIIKFEQDNILLLNKYNKQIYQYHHFATNQPHLQIQHHHLQRPISHINGLLYPSPYSTLQNQLQNRYRAHNPLPFSEEQILNTFIPLFQCLSYIHSQGIVHGSVHPSIIMIDENEEIKIKDWLVAVKQNPYYINTQNQSKQDDMTALGKIMIQTAILKKQPTFLNQNQIKSVLQPMIQQFSKGFLFATIAILKKDNFCYERIIGYLKNVSEFLQDIQMNSMYEQIKLQKQKNLARMSLRLKDNPNPLTNINCLKSTILDEASKKLPGSQNRRNQEENQNKRNYLEGLKKKQGVKSNKVAQLADDFVTKRQYDIGLRNINSKPLTNLSLYSAENYKKKIIQSLNLNSPHKKIRAISRKK